MDQPTKSLPPAHLMAVVAGAGGLGALARHAVEVALPWQQKGWPWAVFLVNMLGCFAIGVATGVLADARARRARVPDWWRPMVVTGFLGGFTTFSTYTYEALTLMSVGQWAEALSYLLGSVILGVGCAWFGVRLAARVPWRMWSPDVDLG